MGRGSASLESERMMPLHGSRHFFLPFRISLTVNRRVEIADYFDQILVGR
jgi:hypothetical protein